jgi:hypothetical protein
MRGIWLGGILLALGFAGCTAAPADEMLRKAPVVRHLAVSTCRTVWTCGRYGCGWRKMCPIRCPDPYLCYPLYGAYGPYGGVGYWGAYTLSGWSYP